ncbi:MAG: 30S ribosomal protein S20 [Candidatus Magasanikbacteria bacterium CG_4_9_14_0_2_um_filter_41_10]|uniref:Small ribosomal subunit protein bS20 n=1 Tax=Candidatus Magasanikbacteria bacterium CG_4_10_14_0_2_um_filter_41_31 TaxID=1974639 RepID=A0A2M7V295_9BACT|nr:MAG: 30S ribosomal protein S20 [Candidatus Magasanikbacteria bacterium CG1_02_41_34]PIZ92536.1 MAG: 30S ribosomal protein S20 [Candidatus Magasanikbacteria bacterium CG_4_10_14_0_2_um_filter_41_31]PJC53676.1 MAG: 30S ribosomal protein S20 [Candidatus Magasanikbacteria bacterium CG_4_9_14_0_2_um_filter_41_10]
MPNKDSAKKSLRQDQKRAARNLVVKNAYKEAVKAAKKTIVAGSVAVDQIKEAQKKLAKAAKKGVIKKNTASRKLSRLAKFANKITTK